jgi:hypothetical protein
MAYISGRNQEHFTTLNYQTNAFTMIPKLSIQYLTDEEGKKTAAVIPIDEWREYAKFIEQYTSIKDSIRRGLQEVKDIKSGKTIPQSVDDFLNEL